MNKNIFNLFITIMFFFLQDISKKSIPPIAEIISALISSYSAHISNAYLVYNLKNHFSSYYKIISRSNFKYLSIYKRIFLFVLNFILHSNFNIYLCLDDTFSPRSSKKAPNSHFINKKGQFLLAQVRIVISIIVTLNDKKILSIPILTKLVNYNNKEKNNQKTRYNTTKLTNALAILRFILSWTKNKLKKNFIVLTDAWYMRRSFVIDAVTRYNLTVIGRVRKDTVLHLPVTKRNKRGRPRIYGERITKEFIDSLPITETTMLIYSKKRKVQYKSIIAYPRFLKGKIRCKILFVKIPDMKQKEFAIIVCTDAEMEEEEIIKAYSKRWKIETMFRELKQIFGMNEIWQKSKESVNKMTALLMASYSICGLMSLWSAKKQIDISSIVPWRKENSFTIGLMKNFMIRILCKYNVRKEIRKIYKEKMDVERKIGEYFLK